LDNLIPEALPLPEAPPAVRLVHLYKLLCGGTFDRSSSSKALPLTVCLRQETVKTGMEQCEGNFVADAPAECAVRPTSAVQVGPSAGVRCDLPRDRPPFLGQYSELRHAHVSLLLNKNAASHFGFVQRSDGARHLLNTVRQLSDQASCFPDYKVAPSISLLIKHILS